MEIKFLKANNGDAFLITVQDQNQNTRNILIDSGMPQTYFFATENSYGDLKNKVVVPIGTAELKIDLMILTHIDEDHIGGIWRWFAKEKETAHHLIGKIWFNSGKLIADEFALKENPLLQQDLAIFDTAQTSVGQAVTFEAYIDYHKIWEKMLIGAGQTHKEFGLTFRVLSPGIQQLKDLVEHYKGEVGDDYFTSGEPLDFHKSIKSFIDEEKGTEEKPWKFIEDDTVTNGSAIAFILDHQEKSFLFLADAHPSVIINSLQKLGYTPDNPIIVEFVKLSHHGSSYNTSAELLRCIQTDNYIISTSGQKHNHPHKRTLSRIVSRNPKANIFFNYNEIKQAIWQVQDEQDYPKITVKHISLYPDDL